MSTKNKNVSSNMSSLTKVQEKYARELRLFVQRLIKMAKEQIVVGRNYGWTQDSMAEELDAFITEKLSRQKKEIKEKYYFRGFEDGKFLAKKDLIEELEKKVNEMRKNVIKKRNHARKHRTESASWEKSLISYGAVKTAFDGVLNLLKQLKL